LANSAIRGIAETLIPQLFGERAKIPSPQPPSFLPVRFLDFGDFLGAGFLKAKNYPLFALLFLFGFIERTLIPLFLVFLGINFYFFG